MWERPGAPIVNPEALNSPEAVYIGVMKASRKVKGRHKQASAWTAADLDWIANDVRTQAEAIASRYTEFARRLRQSGSKTIEALVAPGDSGLVAEVSYLLKTQHFI